MKIYTKESLINELKHISESGWIPNARHGNVGGIGNTLEDLLGITENNLPIPNAAEWELKSQRINTTALTTLKHIEPSPRAVKFVPQVFLQNYSWSDKNAGTKYPENEKSFRQTIHGMNSTDRGFEIIVDRKSRKVLVSFDYKKVSDKHSKWLKSVESRIGLNQIEPQPYWGFDDLSNVIGAKMLNCFYAQAEVKKDLGKEFYKYSKISMLQKFSFNGFLDQIEKGNIMVDFDARTGHNHGTKFRIRKHCIPELYETKTIIV